MATAKVESEESMVIEDIMFTKYTSAADIANKVLIAVINACKPDTLVLDITIMGDTMILDETTKVFKGKCYKNGIAFPTSISINNCACNYNPLPTDENQVSLKLGDVVKIDLGVHIDGYIATVAHTIVVGASAGNKVTGRKADVILAAYNTSEMLLRLLRPGGNSHVATEKINQIAAEYKCTPIEGIISHVMEQNKMLGVKKIIQNPGEVLRKDYKKCDFAENEVYNLDVLISTGEGRVKQLDAKTNIYRRTESVYRLKLNAAKKFMTEVYTKFGNMPFTLRSVEDLRSARLGLQECVPHGVMDPYEVMYEKESEYVAQFKFTLIIKPSGCFKITGLPIDLNIYESEYSVKNPEIQSILSLAMWKKASKAKKKKKTKTNDEDSTTTTIDNCSTP